MSNGLAVMLIQKFIPTDVDTCMTCRLYFRDVLAWVGAASALLGVLSMLSLARSRLGQRRRDRGRRGGGEYERLGAAAANPSYGATDVVCPSTSSSEDSGELAAGGAGANGQFGANGRAGEGEPADDVEVARRRANRDQDGRHAVA